MPTEDDLPLNVPGNPYDPLFAQRIEALGGRSGAAPAPRQPRNSGGGGGGGGGGGWGGGLVAVIIIVNLLRSCSNMSSSNSGHKYDPDWPRTNFAPETDEHRRILEDIQKINQDFDRVNWPPQDKPPADERKPDAPADDP